MADNDNLSDTSVQSSDVEVDVDSTPTHHPDILSPDTQVLQKLEQRLIKEKGVISQRLDFFNHTTDDVMSSASIMVKSELTRGKLANLCEQGGFLDKAYEKGTARKSSTIKSSVRLQQFNLYNELRPVAVVAVGILNQLENLQQLAKGGVLATDASLAKHAHKVSSLTSEGQQLVKKLGLSEAANALQRQQLTDLQKENLDLHLRVSALGTQANHSSSQALASANALAGARQ